MKTWRGRTSNPGVRTATRRTGVWLAGALLLSAVVCPLIALADARTEFLERMLQTSDQFRVRAQAALALGRVHGDPTVVPTLRAALRDEHPAVRAAACASLEQQGDGSALADVQRAQNDSDSSVRSAARHAATVLARAASRGGGTGGGTPTGTGGGGGGNARYYVGIGTPGTRASVSQATLAALRQTIVDTVSGMDGIRVAPQNESNDAARRAISASHLKGFYLDTSVTTVEQRPDGSLRATVSIVVQTYPGRDIKTILQGAATVSGGGDGTQPALEGAIHGALRSLPQALALSSGD